MSRMVSFFVLVGVIILMGVLFFRVMVNFAVPLFFAALFVVMFRPLHKLILDKCKGRMRLAAALTTASILLIVLLPAIGIFSLAVIEGSAVLTELDIGTVRQRMDKLRGRLGLEMPNARDLRHIQSTLYQLYNAESATEVSDYQNAIARLSNRIQKLNSQLTKSPDQEDIQSLDDLVLTVEELRAAPVGSMEYEASLQVAMRQFRDFKLGLLGGPYRAWMVDLANPSDERIRAWSGQAFSQVQDWMLSIGGATTVFAGKLILGIVIMVVAVYFFLLDGPQMTKTFMRLSPLDDRYEMELLTEFDRISRAVVLATLLSAVAQGLLAGFSYWLAGLHSVFLLILLTTVMALVPFLCAASVWASASLWLYFYEERTVAAAALAIYGVAIVSVADNVIKPAVLHGQSRLHPLLALLSVLGGVQALGPIGILVGPMVVVFLQTLLNILHRELITMEQDKAPDKAAT